MRGSDGIKFRGEDETRSGATCVGNATRWTVPWVPKHPTARNGAFELGRMDIQLSLPSYLAFIMGTHRRTILDVFTKDSNSDVQFPFDNNKTWIHQT